MVGGTPKPFACTSEGCTMTFTNEDHLNVHQRKHEMVLNLGNKTNIIVADQTPTPTRFFRNCEEVGLFQDLQHVNPFEETFRRAVEQVKTGSLPEPDLPEDDTLHTPHVFPHLPEENDPNIYNTQGGQQLKNNSKLINTNEASITRTINITETIHTSHALAAEISTNEKSLSLSTNENQSSIFTDKSVLPVNIHHLNGPDHIYALESESKKEKINSKVSISTLTKQNFIVRDKKINIKTQTCNKNMKTINKNSSNILPAKLKLQQILRNNRANKVLEKKETAQISQPILLVQNVITPADKIIHTTIPTVSVVNNMLPVFQTAPILPRIDPVILPIKNITAVTTSKPIQNSSIQNKRKRSSEDTKRLDMLERNRAAATRCREKKKIWIETLESKYENVCKNNSELQKEVSNLKNEVIHLKTLLLAHKNCSVTKAMNMGQNIPIGPPQIVNIQVTNDDLNSEHLLETASAAAIQEQPERQEDAKPGRTNQIVNNISQAKTSVIVLNGSYNDIHS